jgi:hypothetical protein
MLRLKAFYEQIPDQYGRATFWLAMLVALLPAGVVAWLAAQRDWFWNTLGLFGAASVALIAWMVVAIGMAEYQRFAFRRERRVASAQMATSLETPKDNALDAPNVYEGAHEVLLNFVIDHLMPTLSALYMFQEAIADQAAGTNEVLRDYLHEGMGHDGKSYYFQQAERVLSGISMSPTEYVPFPEMIQSVETIEKNYHAYLKRGYDLAKSVDINEIDDIPKLARLQREHSDRFVEMTIAYEEIKRDSRMGSLFRPMRPSRWLQI